ncbi:MAG: AMP-binding protein [Candidatus Adiutrix intracellularis]|jgi:fatty-acyl-CoA synthase|nr:MAG: AMP-binding protein [Candidatus Adiutrix intracellularis]MDR2827239.1 AMP-binding protein [Candidatus Adiutrix intracellularis]
MTDWLRNLTIGSVLEKNAELRPETEALVYPRTGHRYNWRELNEEVDRLARGLMALGVKKNEKVAIWATNVPQWLTTMYATAKIGTILVTVNTHYRQEEIKYLLKQSEAEYLVLMETFRGYNYLESLYSFAPEIKEGHPPAELPHLKKVIFLGDEIYPGLYNYAEVLARAEDTPPTNLEKAKAALSPDDVINMQYTSGTTGFPKGVMLTHQNIVTNGYWIGRGQNLTDRDRICLPVPLFHCFGLVLGAMAALNHGSTMIILDIYSAFDILVEIEKEKCTAIYGVPTMFITLLEQKNFKKFDLSSLRTGIMAGSPCPVKTMIEVIERMHASEITICYGMTETSPVVTQTTKVDSLQKRTETVGRPLPGVEIKVVNPETHEDQPEGEIGEIAVRGYVNMRGYYNMPGATREITNPEGWLYTGDLGIFDLEGYLIVTGRAKDMIIRAGENIYPQEVEEYLRQMPHIIDVQIVAVPSKLHGEELGAFIITGEGAPEITTKDVKAYLRPLISGYKIPRYIQVLDQFPLTASGKVQKFKLREMAIQLWPKI